MKTLGLGGMGGKSTTSGWETAGTWPEQAGILPGYPTISHPDDSNACAIVIHGRTTRTASRRPAQIGPNERYRHCQLTAAPLKKIHTCKDAVDADGTFPPNNLHAAKDAVDKRCEAVDMRMNRIIRRISSRQKSAPDPCPPHLVNLVTPVKKAETSSTSTSYESPQNCPRIAPDRHRTPQRCNKRATRRNSPAPDRPKPATKRHVSSC
jgi:hypothetical protein